MLKKISIVIAYTVKDDGLLLWTQQRSEDGELDGLEEFPGGKIEKDETPLSTAAREYHEEVGQQVKLEDLSFFSMHQHKYRDRSILLYIHTLRVEEASSLIEGLNAQKICWETEENDVKQALFPEANKVFLPLFLKFTKKQLGILDV